MSETQPQTTTAQEQSTTGNAVPESGMLRPLTDIRVQLTGGDGNAFAVLARVREALRRGGRRDLVDQFTQEATSGDYDRLLATCQRYVEVE